MRVSESGLRKFKKLYKEQFGEELCDSDALRKAQMLLNIFEVIFGNPLAESVDRRDAKQLLTNEENNHE
jgi:hypothetical protein